MSQLSAPNFLASINDLTKDTKLLIDNSVELMNDRQAFAKVVNSVDTTEINEKFVSTVRFSRPTATPEGANVGESNSFEGYTTILTPLDKRTNSLSFSFEYQKGKLDTTQKLEQEYNNNVKGMMWGMYDKINTDFFSLLNNGFTTTLSPDGEILFSAAHKFTDDVPTVTFSNLLPAAAPSLDVLADVEERAGAFTDVEGKPMSLNPKIILVKRGGKAFREFKKILFDRNYQPIQITGTNGVNIYAGEYTLIEVPYITSGTAYYFMEDYNNSILTNPLYLGFHQRPSIYGSDDYVDNLTHKIVFNTWYKLGVINVPIGMFGSQGA